MTSSTRVRLAGWLMLLAGLFLVGLVGIITYYLAPELLHLCVPSAGGSHWKGTAREAQLFLILFAVVVIFVITDIVYGLYAIVTGKPNKWMMGVMMGLFLMISLIVFLLNQLLK